MNAGDVVKAADVIGCGVAALKAVTAVESSGHGFDGRGRPVILFEPHVFYRNLRGDNLQHAIMSGIAYPRWGQRPYPRGSDAQYARLEQARNIDNEAAFMSISMGIGQILGENYRLAGHASAAEMFVSACASEGAQLMQMANFIKSKGLGSYLRNKDWPSFARGYNGAGYKHNSYDVKLASAYRRELFA